MRLLRLLLVSVAFMASASGAFAAEPKNGTDYLTLDTPVRADTGKKIEVVEVFMYHCPHCNALEPVMADWGQAAGRQDRLPPPAHGQRPDPQAHAFVTLGDEPAEQRHP